jgi:antitoxin CptB
MPPSLETSHDGVPTVADPDSAASAELRRLRWRARRGMLENDLLLTRFFDRYAATLALPAIGALACLLELPDGHLLDLVLGQEQPQGVLDCAPVHELLALLRAA